MATNPLFIEIGQGLAMMVGLPTIGTWKSVKRPKNAKPGTLGFNTQTNSLEYWDGENWLEAKMGQ